VAKKKPSDTSKVIIVPTGKLGDVVCNTPVLMAIRKHRPKTHIIVAGATKLHRPLLADSGLVDEYLDLGERGAIKRIKESRAQVALVTGPSFESVAPLYLAGVSLIVAPKVVGGYSPSETRPYKILQKFIKTFPYKMGEYAPRERLKVLEPLNIFSQDTQKHLGFSETANKTIEEFFTINNINLGKDFIVGMSPSAGNKIKEWPTDRFAKVADYLSEKYNAKIAIIGSKGEKAKVEEFISYLDKKTIFVNAVGAFNLDELKAFMSKFNLFISVDTGPIYIAESFSIPTIDITGPIDEKEQPPQGLSHRNVVPPERSRPELFVLNARSYNREEALRQLHSISVPLVTKEVDLLISDLNKKS